ncbi:MAG: M1 family metallopeptidase [Bacteroidetes bacterium]|nr:M1 family metallopeptidase [Bacteroidota bacterium]
MRLLLLLLIFSTGLLAQNEYIDFRSVTNPLYWKNRKPSADYWQQDVHYNLKADVNDSSDIVSGHEQLTYWNNSPRDLSYVYFHLYNNAQAKGSYLSDLYKNNNYNLHYGKYREQGLGTTVEHVMADGRELMTELDNTVLKVYLPKPLKSGESVTIDMDFKTYFDKETIRNRMKLFKSYGFKHYDLVHWYPRISVFDRKFGWDTDQHMDHEFYGDFGSFHVEISFPNNYVLDGTGILTNEKDVLPDTLRQKLDISNFAKKPWNSPPSVIIKRDGTRKTWKFSAINVHDFALTADPTYRIGQYTWNGIICEALVQEPHCIGWQTCPQYIAKVLDVNSYNIGPYYYPKMICADAQDGMEYPMLTLDGGFDPTYRDLLIHEMTHNWFFGMVGTNETYRAMMDEGFTQFYTADTYQFIDGPNKIEPMSKSKYVNRYTEQNRILDDQIYNGYMNATITRGEEATLNTHSDDFNGGIRHGGGYGAVYYKTATMLKNLEYVLGRALFDKAMQHYFEQWKFCHPYPEDFRNSVINYTGVDLNWFFDEWMETSKKIDYKIGRIKKLKGKGNYQITFKRKGEMQMPIDFTVIDKNDSAYQYYIPNTWFEKPVRTNVLPRWIGWGPKLKTSYEAQVHVSGKLKNVIIDPSRRLADVDMTNNVKRNRVDLKFDSRVYNPPDWKHYEMKVGPNIWYNGYDGIKVGATVKGNYMNVKHVFDASVWFSTGFGQNYLDSTVDKNLYNTVSFLLNYKTSTNRFIKKSNVYATLKSLDGLESALLGFEKRSNNDKNRIYIQYKGMVRDLKRDLVYLINQNEWQIQKFNSYLNVGIDHTYNYKRGVGYMNLNARAAAFTKDYDYSAITFSAINKTDLGKININTRLFGQAGFGNNLPSESMLYASGANPEELMENKYTRSMGFIPPDWGKYGTTTNHFAAGGGLNLRGYSGYLLAQTDQNGFMMYNYKGTTGASASTEIEFGELLSFMKIRKLDNTLKLMPYLFADAGYININQPSDANKMSNLMMDAGAGIALSINRFGHLYGVKPLTIRFDMPVFINRLPFAEKDYFQFRWMVGINRAF